MGVSSGTPVRSEVRKAERAYSGRPVREIARFTRVTERSVLRAYSFAHAEIGALAVHSRSKPPPASEASRHAPMGVRVSAQSGEGPSRANPKTQLCSFLTGAFPGDP